MCLQTGLIHFDLHSVILMTN